MHDSFYNLLYFYKSISDEIKATFRYAFDMIDINSDGSICVSELRNLVEKTGNSITEEELENMV